jgi:putative addiction module antidote
VDTISQDCGVTSSISPCEGDGPGANPGFLTISGSVRSHCFTLRVITNVTTLKSMIVELKLRKVGNSVGVVLPKEALARLNVEEGDAVYLTETTDGGFRVTANNPGFADKMKVAERLSRKYRHALKELAK